MIKKNYDPRFGMHPSSQSLIREMINLITNKDKEQERTKCPNCGSELICNKCSKNADFKQQFMV